MPDSPVKRSRLNAPRVRMLWRALSLAAASLLLYGCTGGASCGSEAGGCVNGYAYPQSNLSNGVATVDDGIRLRMTQAALNFLREHLQDVLLAYFEESQSDPNVIVIDVGPFTLTDSNPSVRVGQRADGSLFPTHVLIDASELADRLTFEFTQGPRDGVRVRVEQLPIGLDARVYGEWTVLGITGNGGCDLDGTWCPPDNPDCGMLTTLTFDLYVYPDVGQGAQCDGGAPECFLIDVALATFALGNIDSGSIEVSVPPHVDVGAGDPNGCTRPDAPPLCEPECSDRGFFDPTSASAECDGLCGGLDFGVDAFAELGGFLADFLQPVLADLLEEAIRDALADFDGAPLSASDRVDLYALAPNIVSPSTLDLGFFIAPTGNAFDVNCPSGVNCPQTKGMDFVLKSGVEAAPPEPGEEGEVPHPCVNPLVGADFAALYGAGEFFTPDAEPLDGSFQGQPYHLGASVARQGLNQALFATYNSGVLCIEVGTDQVHALSAGAFPLSAGTLDLLTEGKLRQFAAPTAPAVLTVVPSSPPVMRYGAGTEDEGHMVLEWNDVIVSFYVLMYERFARVFAVDVDISAQVSLFADPATETLHVAIIDGPNIEGFSQRYNELLPGTRFDEVLEALVGIAFDALLGEDLGFNYNLASALSNALGVPLYVDFRGLETVPETGVREFLNFYLALSDTPPEPRSVGIPMRLRLADEAGLYRLPEVEREGGRVLPTGEVRLVGDDVRLRPGYEYLAQVDFGTWRGPFTPGPDGVLVIKDPKLSLVGEHVIRLRGRVAGDHGSLAAKVTELKVWVDPYAPWAELIVEGDVVVAEGSDIGTLPSDLVFSFSEDGGPWSEFSPERTRALEDLDGVRRLSVRVRDRAGNLSRPFTLDLGTVRARHDRLEGAGERLDGPLPMGGCEQAPARALGAMGLLLLGAGLLRRRRPRRCARNASVT